LPGVLKLTLEAMDDRDEACVALVRSDNPDQLMEGRFDAVRGVGGSCHGVHPERRLVIMVSRTGEVRQKKGPIRLGLTGQVLKCLSSQSDSDAKN
jgi:hypothetical protein